MNDTKINTDRQSAVELLQQRADGYSLRRIFGKMRREHLLYLAIAMVASVFGFMHPNRPWLWIAGFFAGVLVRDCHWLRAGKSKWPFASRVTDWAKVERMAGVDDATPKDEAATPCETTGDHAAS